eukprot:6112865-Alexandrium_andersonii.AAC.1
MAASSKAAAPERRQELAPKLRGQTLNRDGNDFQATRQDMPAPHCLMAKGWPKRVSMAGRPGPTLL